LFQGVLDSIFFPAIFLAILICFIAIGYLLSKRLVGNRQENWHTAGLFSVIISFFTLVLAFTLSSSSNSNNERSRFLTEHSNTIANLYRSSLSFHDSIRKAVKDYTIEWLEVKIQSSYLHGAARTALDENLFNSMKQISERCRQLCDQVLRLPNRRGR